MSKSESQSIEPSTESHPNAEQFAAMTRDARITLLLPLAQSVVGTFLKRYPHKYHLEDDLQSVAAMAVCQAVDSLAAKGKVKENYRAFVAVVARHRCHDLAFGDEQTIQTPKENPATRIPHSETESLVLDTTAEQSRAAPLQYQLDSKRAELAATIIGDVAGPTLAALANACQTDPLTALIARELMSGKTIADASAMLSVEIADVRQFKSEIRQALNLKRAKGKGHKPFTIFAQTVEGRQTISLIKQRRRDGASCWAIARELNDRGLKSPKAGEWMATTVRRYAQCDVDKMLRIQRRKYVAANKYGATQQEREVISLIVQLYRENRTHKEIAEELNRRGINRRNATARWRLENVQRIVKREIPESVRRTRPNLRYDETADGKRAIDLMVALRNQGKTYSEIASVLNAQSIRPMHGGRWIHAMVISILRTCGIPYSRARRTSKFGQTEAERAVIALIRELGRDGLSSRKIAAELAARGTIAPSHSMILKVLRMPE